jgi:hypothetical protein
MSVDIINQIYRDQLGREPDSSGLAFYLNKLSQGVPPEQIEMEINRSLEGQNFDTQFFTSTYRGLFNRNPEQEGFQYWMSMAQSNPFSPDELLPYVQQAAQNEDIAALERALAEGRYTNVESPSLEADPYGGRFLTGSMYDIPQEPVNVSNIGGQDVQFVAPVTQIPVVTQFAGQTDFQSQGGTAVLNNEATAASVNRALNSGAMNMDQYGELLTDLGTATTIDDVYTALNKPQADLVLDPVYSIQVGQGTTLAEAQQKADEITPVLNAVNQGYFPSNMTIADAAKDMGVYYAFGPDAFEGYDTKMTVQDVLTDQNAAQKAMEAQQYLYQNIGTQEFMPTPMPYGYYSERGLERDFTYPTQAQPALQLQDVYQGLFGRMPDVEGFNYYNSMFGPTIDANELARIAGGAANEAYSQTGYDRLMAQAQGAPMFRSGVFGYTPTSPSGFEFGVQPITQQIPVFTPGVFNFNATGYDSMGNPILAPVQTVAETNTQEVFNDGA